MAKSTKKGSAGAKKAKSVGVKVRAAMVRPPPPRTAEDVRELTINGKPVSNELAWALHDLGEALGTVTGYRGTFDAAKAKAFAQLVYPDASAGQIKEKVGVYEKALFEWNALFPGPGPSFAP